MLEERKSMNKVKKHKPNKLKLILRGILVILGGFIAAYGLETVLIPNNVSDGGVTGLSIVGQHQTHRGRH